MGRPSLKTPEVVAAICERLSAGEPLAQICRDEGMPGVQTVQDWGHSDEAVSVAIARAREAGFDAIASDALQIVDNVLEDPASRRVRADTRLKLLAKWDPKRYGDKLGLVGGDGAGPVAHAVAVSFVTPDKPA